MDNPAFEEEDEADTSSDDEIRPNDKTDEAATQNDEELLSDWTEAHDDSNSVWTTGGWQNNTSQVDSTADQTQGIESSTDDTTELSCDFGPVSIDVEFSLRNVVVTPPMEWVDFNEGSGYLRSGEELGGFAEITFEVPCEGSYQIWGLVWDSHPGGHYYEDDPDSFFISVDGTQEATWIYGCQWIGSTSAWQWHDIRHWPEPSTCTSYAYVWQLRAGKHVIKVRDREALWSEARYPALAGLVVEPVQ